MGDSCIGKGEGDDEIIIIDLLKVDLIIEEIIFVVIIYEVEKRR